MAGAQTMVIGPIPSGFSPRSSSCDLGLCNGPTCRRTAASQNPAGLSSSFVGGWGDRRRPAVRSKKKRGRNRFIVNEIAGQYEESFEDIHVTAAPVDADGASDVFHLIQAHQAAAPRLPPLEEVRTVLDSSIRGMLSTFSKEYEGYPSGSMVDFACDHDGSPVLAVSSLAVHSKNLLVNPKCSLLVTKDPEDQTDIVITLFGDAVPVCEEDREAVRAAYLRRHPNAFWVDFGDFRFIQIKPKFVHYVSGVATALLGSGDFNAAEFRAAKVDPISEFSVPISTHMNKDHADDTKAIVRHSTSIKVDFANILDVDSLGFNVKAGYQGSTYKLRIPFPRRAQDRKDVKTLIIEMLQSARDSV